MADAPLIDYEIGTLLSAIVAYASDHKFTISFVYIVGIRNDYIIRRIKDLAIPE